MHHELPDAPDAPVIEWSTEGGLADPATGSADLIVFADGRVDVGERFAGKRVTAQITPSELQGLLQSALDEHRFFSLNANEIDDEINAAQQRRAEAAGASTTIAVPIGPPYADAGTSRIAIAADGRRHEISRHGLFAEAREFPGVPALAHLRAIERQLLSLAEELADPDER